MTRRERRHRGPHRTKWRAAYKRERTKRATPLGTALKPRGHYRHNHVYVRLAERIGQRLMARQMQGIDTTNRVVKACPCGSVNSTALDTTPEPKPTIRQRVSRVAVGIASVRRWASEARQRVRDASSAVAGTAAEVVALSVVTALAVDAVLTARTPRTESVRWYDDDLTVTQRGRWWHYYDSEGREVARRPVLTGAAAIVANTGAHQWNEAAGGAWVGGVIPTAADDWTIPATSTITIPAAYTALGRSGTVSALGALAFAATTSLLNIGDASGGALTVSTTATITLTAIGTINFVSTSNNGGTGWGLTTGGKVMPGITVNGVGNKIVLQDALTATGATINLTSGELSTGSNLAVTAGVFNSTGALARTLTLGSSAITLTSAGAWVTTTVTNLTVTANTAIVTQSGASTSFSTATKDFNGMSLVQSGSGAQAVGSGTPTFANYTRTVTAVKTDAFSLSGGIICTGTATFNGNGGAINRCFVQSSVVGTPRTITAATLVCTNVIDFQDITGAGAATWTTAASGATYFGDCGGNSGITMTASVTQTATGTASFTWSTHGWTSRVPLPQDVVVINNAFVAGRTITADMPRHGRTVDCSGCTGTPILAVSIASSLFGSLALAAGMTTSGANRLTFAGRSAYNLTSAGVSLAQALSVNAPSGSLTLLDALTVGFNAVGAIRVTNGTLVDGGFSVTITGASAGFDMSAGTLTKTGAWSSSETAASPFWSVTGGTVTDSGSITLTAASTNTRTFAGGGKTYGTLTYTVAGSTGAMVITGANTFATVNFSDVTNARTLTLPASTTSTITTAFNVNGTAGKLMTVNSSTPGTKATLAGSITVAATYLALVDSAAPSSGWSASQSTGSNISGWLLGYYLAVGGTVTPAGALNAGGASINKSLSGTITPTGTVVKQVGRALAGTVTPAGSIAKAVAKGFSGSETPSGTEVNQLAKSLGGTVTPVGSLVKQIATAIAGALAPSGLVVKQVGKAESGALTPVGSLTDALARAFGGSVAPSGDLVRWPAKQFGGTVTPSGSIVKFVGIGFAGSVAPSGDVDASVAKLFGGAVTPSGALVKLVGKAAGGTVTPVGTLVVVYVLGVIACLVASDGSLLVLIATDASFTDLTASDASGVTLAATARECEGGALSNKYEQGKPVTLDLLLEVNGAATDPTTIKLYIEKPDCSITEVLVGAMTHVGVGHYTYVVTTLGEDPGQWKYRWITGGTAAGSVSDSFIVTKALVPV